MADELDRRTLLALGASLIGGAALSGDQSVEAQARRLPRASSVPNGTYLGVVLDLPLKYRTVNWGGGSCVHASTVTLLRWMGLPELADWWRKTYSGGEYDDRLVQRLEAAGVRYASIHSGADRNGDGRDDGEQFLEWCTRTRRGAGLFYKPMHSINFVGMDRTHVHLLDNNFTDYPERNGHYERVPRESFFRQWKGYGGFAWTLVYDPAPPKPFV
jgi:hypothetical protein